MKTTPIFILTLLVTLLLSGTALAVPFVSVPFVSGSICATNASDPTCLGAYSPTVNDTIRLPRSGILDYTTFNVPSGVTVKFSQYSSQYNKPVIIRTSGNVTIAGIIDVSAQTAAADSGTAGDGNLGDDGQPGIGGPGGFSGGRGGLSPLFGGVARQYGGAGKGPGGGYPGGPDTYNGVNWAGGMSGGGGSFGTVGGAGYYGGSPGAVYGQTKLLPLIGGSGGGGGGAGASFNGAGGGGGGGAITIASSGTINFSGGMINANGGAGGAAAGTNGGGGGGGGSGGAIRLVAEVLTRTAGSLNAVGGAYAASTAGSSGAGGAGIISLEANTTNWVGNTNPAFTPGLPGHVLVPNNPTLTIVSVTPTSGTSNGVSANSPASPTGNADITFPTGTTTATVNLQATGIPSGSTADVHVIPAIAVTRSKALSTAFSTPDGNGILTATASVSLSPGNNVLQAAVTYTVTETVAMALPQFNGEYVAKIRVEGGMDGKSKVTYITVSGKEYPAGKAKV
ncbi:MAG TPA: hypothetical protein HPP94_02760 [Desulfuromonadales bacterium]|nr:hypothetical protein [Desulfuromonadales bacterium]